VGVIQVSNLSKRYGDFEAVKNLSFAVEQGEVLGLVGPNGAGKTTTMRCIVGIIPPTLGGVQVCGYDLFQQPVEAKRLLSFIPDDPRLFDYLTVAEHLKFVSRLYGVENSLSRGEKLLADLDLTGRENSLPAELSRGMKQKLAIACGLIHEPRVLILDEPLTGLDPAAIRRMKELICQRAAEGAAVIISSHLLFLVEEICTKVLVLREGEKVVHGTVDEIAKSLPELAGDATLEEIFMRVTDNAESESNGSAEKGTP
jgi:ABC-2 type transport system ATP-binding protein